MEVRASEDEWIDLGKRVQGVADQLVSLKVVMYNRFGKNEPPHEAAERLLESFRFFRRVLDELVRETYPMDYIGSDRVYVPHVFMGGFGEAPPREAPVKPGTLRTKKIEPGERAEWDLLVKKTIPKLLEDAISYTCIYFKFEEKGLSQGFTLLYQRVQGAKTALERKKLRL